MLTLNTSLQYAEMLFSSLRFKGPAPEILDEEERPGELPETDARQDLLYLEVKTREKTVKNSDL